MCYLIAYNNVKRDFKTSGTTCSTNSKNKGVRAEMTNTELLEPVNIVPPIHPKGSLLDKVSWMNSMRSAFMTWT